MRLVIARCRVEYRGRLSAELPMATRLIMIKADGTLDRHCVEPGCDRPPDWCDIHHKTHWADDGVTSVESGELRCRYHHTREHVRKTLARLKTRRRS